MKLTKEEKQLVIAEDRLMKAVMVLDSWFKYMLKEKTFANEDMSEPELEFMDAVKAFKKARRVKKLADK